MVKTKIAFICQACGAHFPQWVGQCAHCGMWNSLVEERHMGPVNTGRQSHNVGYAGSEQQKQVTLLTDVACQEEERISTQLKEFDHVLGGGLVIGSVVLIGGDPGIGKSTLLLQALSNLSDSCKVLYITGEESLQQISLRARRLKLPLAKLYLLCETQIERIIDIAQNEKPQIIVIDSIQTMFTAALTSAAGSVSQIRESAALLVQYAKQTNTTIFLVGHVTKEGVLAGPRVLEHMVDTVLYFEGEPSHRFRAIRAIKNRFGAVNELGIFAMGDTGLREVSNPSAIFLSRTTQQNPGSVILATWEGTRPLLVEVQALVDQSYLSNPRRVTVGLEQNRLAMLLAVLHKHGRIATHTHDVFVNAVGGIRVCETAADLALQLAIISSLQNKRLDTKLVTFGEVGLSGEIRPVPSGLERLREAAKHGFTKAIIPKANLPKQIGGIFADMQILAVEHLAQAISIGIDNLG